VTTVGQPYGFFGGSLCASSTLLRQQKEHAGSIRWSYRQLNNGRSGHLGTLRGAMTLPVDPHPGLSGMVAPRNESGCANVAAKPARGRKVRSRRRRNTRA